MSTILKTENLCKTYVVNKRENNVLSKVNFKVDEGEFVAIMGPSGSGKSTVLYTVSGMDRPTAGGVTFNGRDISQLSDNQVSDVRLNEMGFVFQQMHMLGRLSIFDNIIVAAYNSKNGKTKQARKKINQRAKELMRKFEIMDIADHDITQVSGGQLQRACICRALINQPKMIFADEPTGSLNSSSSKEIMKEFIDINREGNTIMLVTHDIKVAAKSDKVLYIVDGDIQGEYKLGKYDNKEEDKKREKELTVWLMEMGW